ncbi:MAG: hypothetical protein HWN66_16085 [Candidatus Helarchaeota archaeon]|nr:hypothetical protein [Candidatus Helarchaeota archaeon]
MYLLDFIWPPKPGNFPTFIIELGIFIVGIIAGIIGLFIWKNHRILAKEGLPECVIGFFVFAFHSFFDALDTICSEDPIGKKLAENLDRLDSIFSIIGLIFITIGIIRISIYGVKIWKEL